MDNIVKYNQVFCELFNVKEASLDDNFNSSSVDAWSSIMHLNLVNNIEEEFGIMLEADDLLDFKSYQQGKVILAKYGIEF